MRVPLAGSGTLLVDLALVGLLVGFLVLVAWKPLEPVDPLDRVPGAAVAILVALACAEALAFRCWLSRGVSF